MAPVRHGLDIKATVFTWSITTDIRANLLSARFSKRAPAATRILFSACCRDHDDTVLAALALGFAGAAPIYMCSEVWTAAKLGALHETRDAKLANGGYPFSPLYRCNNTF